MSGYRGCDLFMQDTCAMSNPLTSVNTRHITADDIRGVVGTCTISAIIFKPI